MATSHFPTLVFLFLSFSSLAFAERCHPSDKKALLKIKKDLYNAYVFVSWDPKIDCCEWNSVECDEKTNRITTIDISNSDLKLPMPASIGDFNNFTGSIPPSLSSLPKLGGLRLDRNKLTGSIPESFADFHEKDFYLYLSHNQLTGTIPRRLGYTNFTWFDVSRNRLEGDISFLFGKNKSINTADFSRNKLQFDMSNMEFPESLRNLDLNHNKIYGSLPEGLTKVELISLNVSYNRLCGRIPVGGRLQELDYTAYFHNRCLCGAIA
ncbi:UNVERIFIED_CONTAM: Polygalacturonase inhibitor [Sesamum latifolium]|uniref:Polygalacturonase inhibitor n=1 Tax=Sesamum latifolium TaxID=2727402 RepID=A0AAW2XD34_9LAMI